MKFFLKIFFLTFIIAGAVLAFSNQRLRGETSSLFDRYGGSVKGISTKRAENITNQLNSDVTQQVGYVKDQALHIRIVDILNFFNRTQKVANDFKVMQEYLKEQTNHFPIGSKSAEKK